MLGFFSARLWFSRPVPRVSSGLFDPTLGFFSSWPSFFSRPAPRLSRPNPRGFLDPTLGVFSTHISEFFRPYPRFSWLYPRVFLTHTLEFFSTKPSGLLKQSLVVFSTKPSGFFSTQFYGFLNMPIADLSQLLLARQRSFTSSCRRPSSVTWPSSWSDAWPHAIQTLVRQSDWSGCPSALLQPVLSPLPVGVVPSRVKSKQTWLLDSGFWTSWCPYPAYESHVASRDSWLFGLFPVVLRESCAGFRRPAPRCLVVLLVFFRFCSCSHATTWFSTSWGFSRAPNACSPDTWCPSSCVFSHTVSSASLPWQGCRTFRCVPHWLATLHRWHGGCNALSCTCHTYNWEQTGVQWNHWRRSIHVYSNGRKHYSDS